MKTLDKILAILAWIVAGAVFWVLAPFLLAVLNMADHVHKLFTK